MLEDKKEKKQTETSGIGNEIVDFKPFTEEKEDTVQQSENKIRKKY